ncbi:hypothetical protein BPNPMPFG_007411 (plasmid) [Mesorhizobium sp. AR07]|uniref:hypothetical protein n=1 Tax=Mesorhizobium sp. AR07 TaxID=2865838 RepID=UPI002160D5A8|nr:hypothetical protein [Mesorhizobium sp. AR07]UVK48879.1 hypothetical protein BPNPMPFG_007411 [Mesorhizobium sp. AR07]
MPYKDGKGKLRWDKKRRNELSFEDSDEIVAHWEDCSARQSQDRGDFEGIAKRIRPYRDQARTVGEALEMAARDGL